MVPYSIGRGNWIVRLAGGKNLAMFRVKTPCISRKVGCRIEMEVGVRGIPQFLNHRKQLRTPREAIQPQVELLIQLNIASCLASRIHLIEESNEWRSILGLEMFGGLLDGQHLQSYTNF